MGRIVEETATGLLGSGTKTTGYDEAGNVTGRTLPGGKTQSLKWDSLGRLVQVQERDASNDGYNWSATYDGLGRRLKVVEGVGS